MDYKEEQAQEIEILESIYPDELVKISDSEFSINMKLDVESENNHNLLLCVKYPENYPEVAPELDVKVGSSISFGDSDDDYEDEYEDDDDNDDDDDDDDEHKGPVVIADTVYFDDEDLEKLLHKLIEEAEDNIGMPSVFALLSSLKDHAEVLFLEKVDHEQKLYDKQLLEKEMQEQSKFIGTKVTLESFNDWRSKFRDEFGIDAKYRQRFIEIHGGKMTGKEIFEKGLAKGIEDDEELELEKLKIST